MAKGDVKQLGLWDNKAYVLPRFTKGTPIHVTDADQWEKYNGLNGTIIQAPLPATRGYIVVLETGEETHFQNREIERGHN